MSEYQYYEFLAVDRALTREEQRELRHYSTRARITATRFTNEYEWGDFKGDVDEWMDAYFDGFLYLANWGTRTLKLRIPNVRAEAIEAYCQGESLTVREAGAHLVLTFEVTEMDVEEWVEPEGVLGSLIDLREELRRGDLRSLYLGWLLSAEWGELDDASIEPPVPAGLGDLTGAQQELAEFFGLGAALIAVAAQASPPLATSDPSPAQVARWVAQLPAAEKEDLLVRLIAGKESHLASELYLRAVEAPENVSAGERTVGALLAAATELAEEWKRKEALRMEEERVKRERAAAAARVKYLDGLQGRETALWNEVETLAATRAASRHAEAVKLLVDLRDLAERGNSDDFEARLATFRRAQEKRPAFLARLKQAGL